MSQLHQSGTVEILKDPAIISSMLNDFDEQLSYIDHPKALYLFCDGCIFPSAIHGEAISIHAAVHEKIRGKQAVAAGRKVVQWAKEHFRLVFCRVAKDERNVNMYARWCGGKLYKSDDRYNYYEA